MALSVASLQRVKSRASFSAVSTEVMNGVKRTRMEAMNTGQYTAFVVDLNTPQRWFSIRTNNAFDLATFSPAACNVATCQILAQGELPTGISFGPTAGYGAALPAPLTGVPTNPASQPKFCSFCRTAGPANWGSVLFAPGGSVVFSDGPAAIGQQLTMTSTRDGITRYKAIAIVAKTGLIESYEK
jgi:hypothetical protein